MVPVGYVVYQCPDAASIGLPSGRLEILQDARITDRTREYFAALQADVGWADAPELTPPPSHILQSIERTPLKDAIVRLVSADGFELSRDTLDRWLALTEFVVFSSRDSILSVTIDYRTTWGSYNGPVAQLPIYRNSRLDWVDAIDAAGDTAVISLPMTLKTVWGVDRAAATPTILLAKTRPDSTDQFFVHFIRIYLDGNTWRRVERREPGYTDFEGVLPSRNQFP